MRTIKQRSYFSFSILVFDLRQYNSRDHGFHLRSYGMEYSILNFRILNTLRSIIEREGRKVKRETKLEENEECYRWTKIKSLWG